MANVLLLDPERVHPLSTGKHTTLYKTVPDMPVGSCGSGDALDTLEDMCITQHQVCITIRLTTQSPSAVVDMQQSMVNVDLIAVKAVLMVHVLVQAYAHALLAGLGLLVQMISLNALVTMEAVLSTALIVKALILAIAPVDIT